MESGRKSGRRHWQLASHSLPPGRVESQPNRYELLHWDDQIGNTWHASDLQKTRTQLFEQYAMYMYSNTIGDGLQRLLRKYLKTVEKSI